MNLATPSSTVPTLPAGLLAAAFPFYLHWDSELRLRSIGHSLAKVLPGVMLGTSIRDLFRVRRPVGDMGVALFRQDGSVLFLFEFIPTGMILRGQILELDGGEFLMLSNPWIADPEEVTRLGLTIGDFAVHDQTMDLLQVVQTHQMTIEDLKLLNHTLVEQRAMLREQRAEARKLAVVAARTDNAVVITDAKGCIEWVNEGFQRITGWTFDEVRGKTPGSILQGPDTDPATVAHIREHLRRGERVQTEIVNYAKCGRRYWLSLEIQPMYDEGGTLQNFMAVESDITERRLAEQRRTVQYAVSKLLTGIPSVSEALRAVLETICTKLNWTVGNAWRLDRDAELLQFSETWQQPSAEIREFIAYSRTMLIEPGMSLPGRTWDSKHTHWVPNVMEDSHFRRASQAASAGLVAGLALPILAEGEVWGVLEFFHTSIEEPDQKLLQTLTGIGGLVGQFVARKEAEEALRESMESAEAANRAKSDFLATMSHEIRTPMNGVLGFAQLLTHTPLTDEQRDFVNSIRVSSEALLRIINDVLDFSKVESGHMELEKRNLSIQDCIDDALETVSTAALEKNLDLAGRLAPDVPEMLLGDSHRLRQILVNLLGNAVKFTHKGAVRLEVTVTSAVGNSLLLHFIISDSGIGIQPDRLDKLFEPFHQEDSSTSRRFGGTGLGLAICRKLVELMGGRIWVESVLGGGSQFHFELPFTVSSEVPPLVSPLPFPDFASLKALVVYQHDWSRTVLCDLLEHWGMQVSRMASFEEAQPIERPDLILIDDRAAMPDSLDAFIRSHRQSSVFLLCRPADIQDLRARFGHLVTGLITKPLKVSLFFNLLLTKLVGKQEGGLEDVAPVVAGPESFHQRVLLVEDNAINRKLATALLARIGCTPDIAVDGHEALDRATSTRYDLILMDIQMPGMDGLEATRRIREWELSHSSPRTRIVALTANALTGDREICLEAGMDDYLSKPLHFETLRDMMFRASTRLVPKKAAGQPASLSALESLAAELSTEDVVILASNFLEDLAPLLEQVRSSFERGNLDEARRHAHSLKGSSSIFALECLRAAASEVEKACASGDQEQAAEWIEKLGVSSQQAAKELDAGLKHLQASTILEPMS
jgi:two-component system, sensor histidine kinase and response regulator